MAMQEFNISKDWDKVDWKPTLWINFLRAVCVTPWVLMLVLSNSNRNGGGILMAILWPLYYFIMAPLLLLLRPIIFWIGGPLANIMWIPLCFVFISGGDPFVFIISKIKPELVPIKGFNIINLVLFMFVIKDENAGNGSQQRIDSDY